MKSGKGRYKKDIIALFPIFSKKEKYFLKDFMRNIEESAYDEIVEEWGLPSAVVFSYIESQDIKFILKALKRKNMMKNLFKALVLTMFSIIIIYTIFLTNSYKLVKEQRPTEIKETLIIGD